MELWHTGEDPDHDRMPDVNRVIVARSLERCEEALGKRLDRELGGDRPRFAGLIYREPWLESDGFALYDDPKV